MKDVDSYISDDDVSDFQRPLDDLVAVDWVSDEGIEETDKTDEDDLDSTFPSSEEDEVSDFDKPLDDLDEGEWMSEEGVQEIDQPGDLPEDSI